MKPWIVLPYDEADKVICVLGPNVRLTVDYDDVDRPAVRKAVKKFVKTLNEAETE